MKAILAKLHKIQSAVSHIEKAGENKFQGYKYIMLGTILEKVRNPLAEHGLVLTQSVVESKCDLQFNGEKAFYSVGYVKVSTTLLDVETGESISVESAGFSTDKNGDKAIFKAITGARKYGLSLLFKAHWDAVEPEDDSEEEAPPRRQPAQQQRTQSKPKADSGWGF
jgi:hypothetical protein